MKESDFLQVFDLKIVTHSPLFIGNGNKIIKKNYLFNPKTRIVTVFDENKFFQMLIDHHLENDYEQFIMGPMTNLYQFLTQTCCLTERDWKDTVRYSINANDTLDADHSLKDICTFVRDAHGRVYLPGSSAKGAIRTVLLNQMIQKDSDKQTLPIEKTDEYLEHKYLHTLNLFAKNPQNAVNSIMRGIQISDSRPVSDHAMILSLKRDAHTDGIFSPGRGIVCRECVQPGIQFQMKLTLDQSILKKQITRESIVTAIQEYDTFYEKTYLSHFNKPEKAKIYSLNNYLILGGGAGFFSKTLVYPYFGYDEGLEKTVEIMQCKKYRQHHHEKDFELGISPHTIEYTKYRSEYYPMGICEVSIQ